MIVAIFPNLQKSQTKNLALGIKEFFHKAGIEVVAEKIEAQELSLKSIDEVDPKSVDFMISLGGDGTILRLFHRHPEIDAPILGINLGGLGFMADVPVKDIYPSLQDLIDGKYRIEERLVIKGITPNQEEFLAINEIVVHRAQNPCLIDLGIHVDRKYLNTFSADGIIVSTPSGSTAYSLAAGGPIVTPDVQALVVTPISPHTVSNRPIVLVPNEELQIQYLSEYEPVEITYDGIGCIHLVTGEALHVTLSKKAFKIICLSQHDYFSTLRTKLGWSGKIRTT